MEIFRRIKKSDSINDYKKSFVRPCRITARKGKMIYIRPEFHEMIAKIAYVIGDNKLTMSGYIDNVLNHHFNAYGDEITRLYEEKHKGINITKTSE